MYGPLESFHAERRLCCNFERYSLANFKFIKYFRLLQIQVTVTLPVT